MNKKASQINDPSIQYESPREVFESSELSMPEKISLLQDWEYQIRQELVANEESIKNTATDSLHQILELLNKLGADSVVDNGSQSNKMG